MCSGSFALDFQRVHRERSRSPRSCRAPRFDGQLLVARSGLFAPPNNVGLTDALHAVIGP
jgi:hypothetical protein